MDQTPNLQLPYIMPSQAQKHVTHNEAIRALDALVQIAVLNRDLATPPLSPAEGDRYLVAAGGLGTWAGKDGDIAAWQDGAWAYFAPSAGWLVWVADESRLLCHDGAAFVDAAIHSVNPALLVGVNSTADATDRLSVKSPASLFDHEGGDHRMKINKETAGDTASLLFQSGHSGRAEFGLTGDDDWTVKVSADGAAWVEALKVDRSTGRVRLPAGLALSEEDQAVAGRHVREKLSANRTYYVRTDGSDANTGLANDSGGAFLTLQKAIDIIFGLDIGIYDVTIQLATGTYFGAVVVASVWLGSGRVTIQGDLTTPANVHIGTVEARNSGARVTVQDVKTDGIIAQNGGLVIPKRLVFAATGGVNILSSGPGSFVDMFDGASTSYEIEAGAHGRHILATVGGQLRMPSAAVTLTGTPSFSTAFIEATRIAFVNATGAIFTGAATGTRYSVSVNAAIATGGAGAGFFPGDVAGSTGTGGQYV